MGGKGAVCAFYIIRCSAHKIGVGFEQQYKTIDKPTNTEKSNGEQIQDSCTDFALIKFMDAKVSKEETEKECNPFVFCTKTVDAGIDICVRVGIGVIDYDLGLLG